MADLRWTKPFLAGVVAGGAGLTIARALSQRRGFDPALIHVPDRDAVPPVVVVPGILGSRLLRPDGTPVWLNVGNTVGYHSLALPARLPLSSCFDDLRPGPLLGTDGLLPRLFGFTEYSDLVGLLASAGFRPADVGDTAEGQVQHVFAYDWRRDLVESARRLHGRLEALAEARGDPEARFNVIGHSMGGLVARYYLRYGTAEPEDGPVTWAGARRIRNLVLGATPNGGSIPALEGILAGSRVGLSYTTLAAPVVAAMPSMYQLLPPPGAHPLLDEEGRRLDDDLHDLGTWERRGWGPFSPEAASPAGEQRARAEYLAAVLDRAAAFHRALARRPTSPCPVPVILLGGDCIPTLARAVAGPAPGRVPRLEPRDADESRLLFEAGDGRVTRASVLALHLADGDSDCGVPEASSIFFGSADHHGIYGEPTFQSILLRLLLRAPRPRRAPLPEARASVPAGPCPVLTDPAAGPTLAATSGGEADGAGVVRIAEDPGR